MYERQLRDTMNKIALRAERAVWTGFMQYLDYGFFWPSMSRDDWWEYWRQMQEACNECRGASFSGGPSPVWPHAEHIGRTNKRPWRGPH